LNEELVNGTNMIAEVETW